MSNPFVAALDALYASALAIDAVFTSNGVSTPVRTVRSQPDQISGYGEGQIVQASNLFELRRSEVSEPSAGDTIAVGADVFAIVGDPMLDTEGLAWTCAVRPA